MSGKDMVCYVLNNYIDEHIISTNYLELRCSVGFRMMLLGYSMILRGEY